MKSIIFTFLTISTIFANTVPKIMVDGQQLLKSLAYDEHADAPNIYDWKLIGGMPGMIAWDPEGNKWSESGYEREGNIVLSNEGKITHHTVGDAVGFGYWKLQLFAKKSRIVLASISPNTVTQENPNIKINIVNIQEKVVCEDTNSSKQIGYFIKYPGKKAFWIVEQMTISPKGKMSAYNITFDAKPKCVIQKERDDAEAKRLEEQKRIEEAKIAQKKKELELLRKRKEELEKIRKANEELQRQEEAEIERAKKKLEELLDQKIDLANTVGVQEAFNNQQRLKLLNDKIELIKYQKKMAHKIDDIKDEIDRLDQELSEEKKTLDSLKKTKNNREKIRSLQKEIKVKKKLLSEANHLLKSYQDEKELHAEREKLRSFQLHMAVHGSEKDYVIKKYRFTESSLEEKNRKYQKLQEKLSKKIDEVEHQLVQQKEKLQVKIKKPKEKTDQNASVNIDLNNTIEMEGKIIEYTEGVLESYHKKKAEYELLLQDIEKAKKKLHDDALKKKAPNDNEMTYASSREYSYAETQKSNNRISLSSFLHSYINAGNSAYSPSVAARYYASFVHPYFKIRNATRQDILRDKQKYYRKWPDRNYQLTKYTVIDRYQRAGLSYLEVILEIDWRVASPKRGTRTGHSVVTMTLIEDGDSYKITAVRNAHIQRDIPVKPISSKYAIYDGGESGEDSRDYTPIYFSGNGLKGKMKCSWGDFGKTCTISVTNNIGTGKGGISISFPNVHYRSEDIRVESSRGFNGDVKFYSQGSLLWSTQYGRKINSNYLLLEGWAKRWLRGETKRIQFSLGAVSTPVQMRAVVVRHRREYITPTDYSTVDQQGYPVAVLRW